MTAPRDPELTRRDAERLISGRPTHRPRLEQALRAVRIDTSPEPGEEGASLLLAAREEQALVAFRAAPVTPMRSRRSGRRAAVVAALSSKVVVATALTATAVSGTVAVTLTGVLPGPTQRPERAPSAPAGSTSPGSTSEPTVSDPVPSVPGIPRLPSEAATPPVDTPPRDGLPRSGRPSDLPTGAPSSVPTGPASPGGRPSDLPSGAPTSRPSGPPSDRPQPGGPSRSAEGRAADAVRR